MVCIKSKVMQTCQYKCASCNIVYEPNIVSEYRVTEDDSLIKEAKRCKGP